MFHIGPSNEKAVVNARVSRRGLIACGRSAPCPGLIGYPIEAETGLAESLVQLFVGSAMDEQSTEPSVSPLPDILLWHPHAYRIETQTGYYAVLEPERDERGRRVRKQRTRRPVTPSLERAYSSSGAIPIDYTEYKRIWDLSIEQSDRLSDRRRGVMGQIPVLPAIVRCAVCGHPNRVTEELIKGGNRE